MIDIDHLRLLKAVAHAVHAYREAMRHYIREQTGLLDEGMPIEGLTDRIAGGFAELAEAEDALTRRCACCPGVVCVHRT